MNQYAGIDVSLESSAVCVVDAEGKIVCEAKVLSEPEALIAWFAALDVAMERIGLEAGPLSQWLYAAMAKAGLSVELLETRHVRAAFKIMPVKTDKKDARGIAQLMRMGWFRPVHCKSLPAQEVRAVLTARKLLQGKLHDLDMSIRGILRGFGLKVGDDDREGSPRALTKTFEMTRVGSNWTVGMRLAGFTGSGVLPPFLPHPNIATPEKPHRTRRRTRFHRTVKASALSSATV